MRHPEALVTGWRPQACSLSFSLERMWTCVRSLGSLAASWRQSVISDRSIGSVSRKSGRRVTDAIAVDMSCVLTGPN